MSNTKPIATFTGGTFRENLLGYSKQRMTRDPQYKVDVVKASIARREKRKAEEAAKKAAEQTSV